MAYLTDIKNKLAARDGLFASYEVHVLGGRLCVIEGHKGLYSLTAETLVVRVVEGLLSVEGKELRIDYADENEICAVGEIFSVSRVSPSEGMK